MNIIDRGTGTPVVLVPGIQGRWEWTAPTVDALSTRCRVITFSLADEPTSGATFDTAAGFEAYLHQIDRVLDAAGLRQAVICGISYGGLIAAAYAARRPDRVSAVIVTSAIPPSWAPDRRVRFLMRAPRLLSPLFCISSVRLVPEMISARGGVLAGLAFAVRHSTCVLRNLFSPRLMARRVRMLEGLALEADIARVRMPALVITGEPHLDLAVPVALTREYLKLWPQAREATIARAGHLGPISRPDVFADLVAGFVRLSVREDHPRRRIG